MFDEEKCLILDKNKNDITNKVFGEKDGKFMVSFNSAKPAFAYNKFNLTILENPVLLSDFFFSTSYQTLNNVQKALQFDDYIKIFFKNGKTKVYLVSEIIMKKNLLCEKKNKDLFLYLKELADNLTIEDMDSWNENKSGEKISILKKNYEKMSYVQEESVLKNFFSLNKSFEKKGLDNYIYPFSFNLSQQKAVNNAFKNTISIIEGPPGTGKTQTILNILSNAILNNKTVAVLSNNNSATDNVYEKLEKRGLASLCAKLGKKKNVEKFLITQSKEKTFPDSWNLDESAIQKYLIEMKSMELKVRNYLIQKNEIALLEQELSDLLLEYEHFKKSSKNILNKEIPIPNFSSKKLHSYLIFLNKFENKGIYFDNFIQIISQIRYPFINPKLYHFSIEDIFTSLEVTYYERRINEIQHKLGSLNQGLLELDLKSYFDKYTELSLKIFQSYVYGKYRNKTIFSEKEVKNTKNFIKEYPIILSTTYSILNCVTPDFLFDYMIIDESSQVDLVSAFPALSLAKNIVVVGDSKQLPNIIDSTRKEFFDELFLKYDLPEKFNYTQNSLLGLTKELYKNVPSTMLREHYRCHPKIIGFCNKCFYNDELIILSENTNDNPIKQYKCVPGNHARCDSDNSQFNDRQAEVIIQEVIPNEKIDIHNDSIGIITPYKAQKKHLIKKFNCSNVSIDTVHGFQGRENDVIIFSTVANWVTKFLDNPNSINVAVSRAIKKLILVTPFAYKSDNSNISSLINYISYNNFEIVQSNINSVFDLLYRVNNSKKNSFLLQNKIVSIFFSENLMYSTIKKVLSLEEYQNLQVTETPYPLRCLVKDTSVLTQEEIKFIKTNSHVDFLIFNKFDKRPVLAIEVDGYKFHSKKEQIVRDQKKNKILDKCEIPLIRFRSNECDEDERLKEKLEELMNK